jgi:hypothetical protein
MHKPKNDEFYVKKNTKNDKPAVINPPNDAIKKKESLANQPSSKQSRQKRNRE